MPQQKYYHAYDDRYRQVHEQNLQWSHENPSQIVAEAIATFAISRQHRLLEIGCGEGRDAFPLLEQGYDLLATDVSPEAIAFCRGKRPAYADRFRVVDCISGLLNGTFDFIYAVAVVHMLVPDEDRDAFYTFIRDHLSPAGLALICTMGDGVIERQTDIRTAFDLQRRVHRQSGRMLQIANTSCRMVSFRTWERELERNSLNCIKKGMAAAGLDFPQMMYTVIGRRDRPSGPPAQRPQVNSIYD